MPDVTLKSPGILHVPLSPQALPTGKVSRRITSCKLMQYSNLDKFQANLLVNQSHFLSGMWEDRTTDYGAEFLRELSR